MTHFLTNFFNNPLDYLWQGILVVFVVVFLVRYAKELWESF
jgi:hypothetical protein